MEGQKEISSLSSSEFIEKHSLILCAWMIHMQLNGKVEEGKLVEAFRQFEKQEPRMAPAKIFQSVVRIIQRRSKSEKSIQHTHKQIIILLNLNQSNLEDLARTEKLNSKTPTLRLIHDSQKCAILR